MNGGMGVTLGLQLYYNDRTMVLQTSDHPANSATFYQSTTGKKEIILRTLILNVSIF